MHLRIIARYPILWIYKERETLKYDTKDKLGRYPCCRGAENCVARLSASMALTVHACRTRKSINLTTLRPRQNGRHIPDDIFKYIFVNENIWISITLSMKFVPKLRVNNIPTMASRWPGAKPLSEPMIVYWRIYASPGLNELNGMTHQCRSTRVLEPTSGFKGTEDLLTT